MLIVDLRGNPGGYVTAARTVASQFIGSGPIFWEEDAKGGTTSDRRDPGGAATDPIDPRSSVLIDRGSASASEIVAASRCMTAAGRPLVGQRSFGKGTVQQWQELAGEGGGIPSHDRQVAHALTSGGSTTSASSPIITVDVPATLGPGEDRILARALDVVGAGQRPSARRPVATSTNLLARTVPDSGTVHANERR
jgi:C-terminal processing protease CtpA/Prc